MTETNVLTRQTNEVYDWTNKFLQAIPFEKWDSLPDVLETTVNWQVGHLIVSHYYHSIWVIKGMQMDVVQKLPLKVFGDHFTSSLPMGAVGKFNAKDLFMDLKYMQEKSMSIISQLTEAELSTPLELTGFSHPVAKTKREAIEWNIQHTMYHCGQIGVLNRVLNKRFDFGLKV